MSRSSKSSRAGGRDKRPWLKAVHERKRGRTVELVKLSVDALLAEKKVVSLSSVEAKSKELDPKNKGVHRNTVLGNEEARAYYEKNSNWKQRKRRRPPQTDKTSEAIPAGTRLRIKIDRDVNLARRRYQQLNKTELIERLLLVEQAYAEAEEIWLRDKDETLNWQLRAEKAEVLLRERDSAPAKMAGGDEKDSFRAFKDTKDERPVTPHPPSAHDSTADLNHYEYFAEIEELFIRRRGRHLQLSPVDWALLEGWKERGVPLHIALRAIDQVFDRHEAKGHRRSVKSLHYCKEEVEAQFAEWLQGQVGAGAGTSDGRAPAEDSAPQQEENLPFPRAAIIEHLGRCRAAYSRERGGKVIESGSELFATLSRVADRLRTLEEDFAQAAHPDAGALEEALTELDILVGHAMRAHLSPTQLAERRGEAEEQLRSYRGRMEPSAYEQTLDIIVSKCLRQEWGVPRLSLYYL